MKVSSPLAVIQDAKRRALQLADDLLIELSAGEDLLQSEDKIEARLAAAARLVVPQSEFVEGGFDAQRLRARILAWACILELRSRRRQTDVCSNLSFCLQHAWHMSIQYTSIHELEPAFPCMHAACCLRAGPFAGKGARHGSSSSSRRRKEAHTLSELRASWCNSACMERQ